MGIRNAWKTPREFWTRKKALKLLNTSLVQITALVEDFALSKRIETHRPKASALISLLL